MDTFTNTASDFKNLVLTCESSLYTNEDIIFLGKWGIDYSDKLEKIRSNEKQTLPYPFDQENSLLTAYGYLQSIDSPLFKQLCVLLNKKHCSNHSYRYWRIIVGYWWREFLEVVYERYLCIINAHKTKPYCEVKTLSKEYFITPYDSKDFEILYKGDLYNHQIYTQIIDKLNLFNPTQLSHIETQQLSLHMPPPLKEGNRNLIKYIMSCLSKWNSYYFSSTYIIPKSLAKIALKLKCFPTLDTPRFLFSNDRKVNMIQRHDLQTITGSDSFSQLIAALLPSHLPKIYWEDFSHLLRKVHQIFPQKKLKRLLTANAFACNEGFKINAAEQIERFGTPFIIAQHGGNYGCAAWNSSEDYEKEIADTYLTYGWEEQDNPKVKPFIVNRFNQYSNIVTGDKTGNIIWVLASFPRYAYTMYAVPVGPQFVDYLNQQAKFLQALPETVRDLLRCRTYQYTYGWHDLKYIEAQTNYKLTMSNLKTSLISEAQSSRLVICTYNATAHLETFSLNIPTLLYWDPTHWPLRPSAQALHNELHKAGILHYTPESAAEFATKIYKNPLAWWSKPDIQRLRKIFCQTFAHTDQQYDKLWHNIIANGQAVSSSKSNRK